MVGWAGILFFPGADERAAFHTGHIVFSCAVQKTTGQFFFVQFNHLARLNRFFANTFQLFF